MCVLRISFIVSNQNFTPALCINEKRFRAKLQCNLENCCCLFSKKKKKCRLILSNDNVFIESFKTLEHVFIYLFFNCEDITTVFLRSSTSYITPNICDLTKSPLSVIFLWRVKILLENRNIYSLKCELNKIYYHIFIKHIMTRANLSSRQIIF